MNEEIVKTRTENWPEDRVEILFLEGVLKRLPDHVRTLKALGDLYSWAGDADKSLSVDRMLTERCPDDEDVWYNLACSYALTHQPDQAFRALSRAIDTGYKNTERLLEDADLTILRSDKRFDELLHRIECL